jgi:hypothetical protein
MTTKLQTPINLPEFVPPTMGAIDFGIPSTGKYSDGYKMVAFEPGKILQAQELNEIQFRMNVHETLTMRMISNWLNTLVNFGSSASSGPGWEGATPLDPSLVSYNEGLSIVLFEGWYLCKANSNNMYFWLYLKPSVGSIVYSLDDITENSYIGFTLNTTANQEYTGEIVSCNDKGADGDYYSLNVKSSSACGSSRYYLRITDVTTSTEPITNSFVAIAQRRSDGFYFLNNIKVTEQ